MRSIQLSTEQARYLAGADYLPRRLRERLDALEAGDGARLLSIDDDVAEACRGAFTERLAEVGFDQSYSLTEEGQMLETLIDRFNA
jgi:hypothetical protein